MDTIIKNLRFALRLFRRQPLFSAAAILTVAVGIGATTAIFTLVDAALLRPLPYRDPGRLVYIWLTFDDWKDHEVLKRSWEHVPLWFSEYRDLEAQQSAFEKMAAYRGRTSTLVDGGYGERVVVGYATPSLLDVLGVRPALGRWLAESEQSPQPPKVVVIGYDTWQRRFAGDPAVLDRTIRLDDTSYQVIGVAPAALALRVTEGRDQRVRADFWCPIATGREQGVRYDTVARLKPGVSPEDARLHAARILGGTTYRLPRMKTWGMRMVSLRDREIANLRRPLWLLMAAAGIVLLVACANVANLLLSQVPNRRSELATRAALGAGRGRLVGQLLTESLLLTLAGSVLGLVLAAWGTSILTSLAPPDIPFLEMATLDLRILAFVVLATAATGIFFGLVPAFSLLGRDITTNLKRSGVRVSGGRGRLQPALIVVEVALSFVALVGAALFSQTLSRLSSTDLGFKPDGLLTFQVNAPRGYDDERLLPFYRQVAERLSAIPGVRVATGSAPFPFTPGIGLYSSCPFEIEGVGKNARFEPEYRRVLPGYLQTVGIPLVEGRYLEERDYLQAADRPVPVVLSRSLAQRLLGSESPVGRRIKAWGNVPGTVVGVVGDVRDKQLGLDSVPTFYLASGNISSMGFVLGTSVDPMSLAPAVRSALREIDPLLPVMNLSLYQGLVDGTLVAERYRASLVGFYSLVALVLSAVGIYAVTGHIVARRRREIAVRVALGARRWDVLALVLRQGAATTVLGVALGWAGALAMTRVVSGFLFGISALDMATYVSVGAVLALVTMIATYVPARRATAIEPTVALRCE